MLGHNRLDSHARLPIDKNQTAATTVAPREAHTHTPYRPHRVKRAIPVSAAMASLGSSVSQLSLLDDHTSMTSSIHVSLSSSPSTISPASSLVDARQLDSGVDLQEAPRPVNRRSNRNFRIIPAAEIEVMNETSLQDSIRRSQKLQNNLGHDSSSASSSGRRGHDTQPQDNGSDKQSPQLVLLHDPEDGYEDEEESYFGDILDKYCNSDEDPTSPMTASPTSPFSTAPGWKAFQSAQPPTPPVSRSFNLHSTAAGRRERGAVSKAAAVLQDHHSSAEVTSHSRQDRSRINSSSGASSPVNAACAKFSMHQHSTTAANHTHDSLSKAAFSPSSTRSYTKRPPPPPKDDHVPSLSSALQSSASVFPPRASSSTFTASASQQRSLRNKGRCHSNNSSLDLREGRPEPPPKDSSRRTHHHHASGSSTSSSQPPMLSLDAPSSGHFNSFTEVVEATMSRHRASPSVSSFISSPSHQTDTWSRQPHPHSHSSSSQWPRSDSSPKHASNTLYQKSASNCRNDQVLSHGDDHGKGQGRGQDSSHSLRNQSRHVHHDQSDQHHFQQQQQQLYAQQSCHTALPRDGHYRMHGSTSQLDLMSAGLTSHASPTTASSRTFSQSAPYLNERARSYSHGSISTACLTPRPGHHGISRGLKSALVKTPIARARAKEVHGSRKVIFGDMITVVTIERAETPPPAPLLDKKARKKLQQAKKNASSKGQVHNFDPEYNAAFFNAPYTPTPAEVVVTLAPWIGNPNYDEEKQNSKFYYDDDYDYEYDEEEYEVPYESDIRLGPEDDDEDEDEDEDDEDDEEYGSRTWGHGIAGPGGALPKKKGGMFKFKRAVNKLLRN